MGLISGIIVLVVSVTGCLFVFYEEITTWQRKNAIYNDVQGKTQIPVSQLYRQMENVMGEDKTISWVNIYNDPRINPVFYSYKYNPEGLTYFGTIIHYESVYADPYSGEVKGIYDEKNNFFSIVKFLHWSLLLNTPYGQPIVGWSTFIFVILLLTGLVLWWPKSIGSSKNNFWIKWKTPINRYRKLYDLHNVPGFYILPLALVIALTGMVWSFDWFQKLVYVAASGTTVPPDHSVPQSVPSGHTEADLLDRVIEQCREHYPDAYVFRFSLPADTATTASLSVYVQQHEGRYAVEHDLHFDRYSGKLLKITDHAEKNAGEKLLHANYDIHVGAIGGLPGKILAFLISLICASLPVTGFWMWLDRQKKRKRRTLTIQPEQKRRTTIEVLKSVED